MSMIKHIVLSSCGFMINGIAIGIASQDKLFPIALILMAVGGIMIAIGNYYEGSNMIKEIYGVGKVN